VIVGYSVVSLVPEGDTEDNCVVVGFSVTKEGYREKVDVNDGFREITGTIDGFDEIEGLLLIDGFDDAGQDRY